jgi:AraC-like DNA-binding protein
MLVTNTGENIMKRNTDSLDYVCRHILRCTHAPIRHYVGESESALYAYYGDAPDEDAILNDKERESLLLEKANPDCPILVDEDYPIYYAVVTCQDEKSTEHIFLVGPVSVEMNGKSARGVAYCDYEDFCEEILLLYNLFNDTQLTYNELNAKNYMTHENLQRIEKNVSHVQFQYHENSQPHNPYDRERREMLGIKTGDVTRLLQSIDEIFMGEYAVLSKNKLQSAKNLAIVGLAISARAAIDGGMPSEEAFSLNDSLILEVDKSKNIGEIENIVRYGKIKYAEIVKSLNEKKDENAIIDQCKNLIFRRLHSKIVISELADILHVSLEYLSALFKRTEQITISEYIMNEKVKLAQNLLVYSEYSLVDISMYLGFSSQSHFGRVFKKYTGLTPNDYRKRNAKKYFIID